MAKWEYRTVFINNAFQQPHQVDQFLNDYGQQRWKFTGIAKTRLNDKNDVIGVDYTLMRKVKKPGVTFKNGVETPINKAHRAEEIREANQKRKDALDLDIDKLFNSAVEAMRAYALGEKTPSTEDERCLKLIESLRRMHTTRIIVYRDGFRSRTLTDAQIAYVARWLAADNFDQTSKEK